MTLASVPSDRYQETAPPRERDQMVSPVRGEGKESRRKSTHQRRGGGNLSMGETR